jgi:putative transposase
VRHVVGRLGLSKQRACRLVSLRRATLYYRSRQRDDSALRKRILELAELRRRFGQHRIWVLLRREGWKDNHKRVSRVYREEGLQVRKRRRKKRAAAVRVPLPAPSRPNERWSMDFVMDALQHGRRIRILTIVDDFTRECLATEVDTSIGGVRVTQVLDRLVAFYGKPDGVMVDNGPEFAGRALDAWAYGQKIRLDFIRPGKPVENAYIESFNGRLRDECLNVNEFISLRDAQNTIGDWKEDYNDERPHGSLGDLTPREFARSAIKKLETQDSEKLRLEAVR